MKLKTLKDIQMRAYSSEKENVSAVWTDDLKEVAKEWIDNWRKIDEEKHSNEIRAFWSFFNLEND